MKQETLGQIFKRYRQAEAISLEQVEQDTKISKQILLALENDNYAKLPDEVYVKNIIKNYAKYLALDYNRLLAVYEKGKLSSADQKNIENKKKQTRIFLTPDRFRNIIISLIVVSLLAYFGFQISRIFKAPELIVSAPVGNLIIQDNFIEIKGQTEKEAQVFINEKEVFLDKNGEFKAALDLHKGLNVIKITAVKKYSREQTVFREILVQ
ncbi:MAG TPA: helix-turn-helix domain-containing protein [Candidatus Uhrbacteria bacterium]|nr:helix-turn-helix domain-containing protein [Candidatus Uhrbacteria bacterium]